MVWAGRVRISCTVDSARMRHCKFLCSKHFSESDFTTAERVHLNRFAVPCGTDSAAQSVTQPPDPSLHTPSFDPVPSCPTSHQNLQQDTGALCCSTCSYPCRQSFHFLSNACNSTINSSSQHLCSERNLLSPMLLMGNSGMSLVKVLPQSLEQGILC
jgi:hypothetical protein